MIERETGSAPSGRCRILFRSLVSVFLLVLSIAACEPSAPPITVEGPFVVSDSLGVIVADNLVQEWELEDELRLVAIPFMRFGEEGSGLELWGIQDVVGIEGGGFLIGMDVGREVLLIDSVGQETRRLEAKGAGPGEFLRLQDLAVRPSGGFGGYDAQLQRVVMFDDNGQVEHTVTIHAGEGHAQRRLIGFLKDEAMLFGEERAPEPNAGPGLVVVEGDLVVYSPDGQPGDTLMTLPFQEYYRFTGTESTSGALALDMRLPLGSRAFVRVHDEKVYVAQGDAYEIRVMDASGSLERLIRYRGPLRPFESEHREGIIDRMRGNIPNSVRAEWDRRIEALPWPTTFPAIEALEIDLGGRVWVCGHREADVGTHDDDPFLCRWSVFEPDGRMLGSVFSGSWNVMGITGNEVIKRSQGEMDQDIVEVFTIEWNP